MAEAWNRVFTLSGGTLLLGSGATAGGEVTVIGNVVHEGGANSQGFASLTLCAFSTLDFGTSGVGDMVFGSFNDSLNYILTIADYTNTGFNPALGNSSVEGADDRLIFASMLNSTQLADINFGPGEVADEMELGGTGYYELSAVPEPGAVFAALLLVGAIGFREHRRIFRLIRPGKNAPSS